MTSWVKHIHGSHAKSLLVVLSYRHLWAYNCSMPLHAWHVSVSMCKVVQTYEDETLLADEPTLYADEPD